MVGGCKIEYENYPHQIERPQVYNFGAQKSVKVDIEIEKIVWGDRAYTHAFF